jgi:hypothetical protein
LGWDEVEAAAQEAFSVWMGQPELAWAKQAWELVVQAHLADSGNEIDRCRAAIRFLAMCTVYLGFCQYAWDEQAAPDFVEWAELLDLSPFRVGQLVDGDYAADEALDDYALVDGALARLTNEARHEVVQALSEALGGTAGLFVSLWRSRGSPALDAWTDDLADKEPESDDEILSTVTAEKGRAYQWLDEGCPA